jgi:hypothetical protein
VARLARFFGLSLFLFAPALAFATPFGPEEATELLAKTMAADIKCQVLSPTERDQLQTFVAQAEIALAEQTNVPTTKAALARGRTTGAKIACDATTAKAVRGVLATTRDAMESSVNLRGDEEEPKRNDKIASKSLMSKQVVATKKAEPETVEPTKTAEIPAIKATKADKNIAKSEIVKPLPKPPVVKQIAPTQKVAAKKPEKKIEPEVAIQTASIKKPAAPEKVANKKSPDSPKLVAYSKLAEAYFHELKCRTMSKTEVLSFYGKVQKNHKIAVAAHGGGPVSSELRAAQARANGKACG